MLYAADLPSPSESPSPSRSMRSASPGDEGDSHTHTDYSDDGFDDDVGSDAASDAVEAGHEQWANRDDRDDPASAEADREVELNSARESCRDDDFEENAVSQVSVDSTNHRSALPDPVMDRTASSAHRNAHPRNRAFQSTADEGPSSHGVLPPVATHTSGRADSSASALEYV
jgi:hypothetical protein